MRVWGLPSFKKVIQTNDHPTDPEQVSAYMKALAQQAVGEVVAKVLVGKKQPDSCQQEGAYMGQRGVVAFGFAVYPALQHKEQHPAEKNHPCTLPPDL
jgi:hypothetical protein